MNLYIRELKANLKPLLIWSVSIIIFILIGMGKYAAMGSTDQQLNDMIANMPKSIQAIMGAGVFDLNTARGFYAVVFLYLVLMSTIQSGLLGASIIIKEERDQTIDFLLTKPISRNQVITAKLGATITNILIVNIITLIASILIIGGYSAENITGDILTLMVGMLFLQLLFMSIGLVFATSARYKKRAGQLTLAILLTTYFLSIIVDMVEQLNFLRFITPFKYFDAKTLLVDGGFNPLYILITLGVTGVLIYYSYANYHKRDLL
jgi:ABC-2 type transport system permease protein